MGGAARAVAAGGYIGVAHSSRRSSYAGDCINRGNWNVKFCVGENMSMSFGRPNVVVVSSSNLDVVVDLSPYSFAFAFAFVVAVKADGTGGSTATAAVANGRLSIARPRERRGAEQSRAEQKTRTLYPYILPPNL